MYLVEQYFSSGRVANSQGECERRFVGCMILGASGLAAVFQIVLFFNFCYPCKATLDRKCLISDTGFIQIFQREIEIALHIRLKIGNRCCMFFLVFKQGIQVTVLSRVILCADDINTKQQERQNDHQDRL